MSMCAQVVTLNVSSQSEGPRWNMFQWLHYWCTRQTGPDQKLAVERKDSVTSLDDEADSRDVRRK